MIVCVPSISPISSVSIVRTALLPVVVPIEVKIGYDDTSKPLFKISMECIPPSSVVDFVE